MASGWVWSWVGSRPGEVHPGGDLDGLNGAPHPLPMKGSREGGQDVLPEHGLERLAQSLLGAFDRQNVAAAPTHNAQILILLQNNIPLL